MLLVPLNIGWLRQVLSTTGRAAVLRLPTGGVRRKATIDARKRTSILEVPKTVTDTLRACESIVSERQLSDSKGGTEKDSLVVGTSAEAAGGDSARQRLQWGGYRS